MYRRSLLVAVAGLSGCTGVVPGVGGGSDDGDASTGQGAADDVPTVATSTGTATPTPDGLPSAEDLRGRDVADLLALARDETDRAIEAYVGDGTSLSSVTAASDAFEASPVIERLYRARAAYEAANRQGISADQEETIVRLRQVGAFLRLAIDAQVLLVEAHTDLEELAAAVEYVEPGTATSIRDRVRSRHERTLDIVSELSQPKYEGAVGVVGRLSREEYDAKRLQFSAEGRVLGKLAGALGGVLDGLRLLSQARGKRRSGAPYTAAELARDAESAFAKGGRELDAVAGEIPAAGRGFAGVTGELVDRTEAARAAAGALHREIL
jgi:hypothetical protein